MPMTTKLHEKEQRRFQTGNEACFGVRKWLFTRQNLDARHRWFLLEGSRSRRVFSKILDHEIDHVIHVYSNILLNSKYTKRGRSDHNKQIINTQTSTTTHSLEYAHTQPLSLSDTHTHMHTQVPWERTVTIVRWTYALAIFFYCAQVRALQNFASRTNFDMS